MQFHKAIPITRSYEVNYKIINIWSEVMYMIHNYLFLIIRYN